MYMVAYEDNSNYCLAHHGIKGQKWGIRRYQNEDGSLTAAGEKRYGGGVKGDIRRMNDAYNEAYKQLSFKEKLAYDYGIGKKQRSAADKLENSTKDISGLDENRYKTAKLTSDLKTGKFLSTMGKIGAAIGGGSAVTGLVMQKLGNEEVGKQLTAYGATLGVVSALDVIGGEAIKKKANQGLENLKKENN